VTVALYVFITDFAYVARSIRANMYKGRCTRKRERELGGMKRETYFRWRGNFHRFPRVNDFPTGSSASCTHDTSVPSPRSERHKISPLWKSTFVRQVQPGARSFMHVNLACWALSIVRPDSSRDAVNMLIYWRRVRFEYTYRWRMGTCMISPGLVPLDDWCICWYIWQLLLLR